MRRMVDILVRNVDARVAQRLKQKAKVAGKSVNDTARAALAAFVKPDKAELIAQMQHIRALSSYSKLDSTVLIREDRDNDEPDR
jgi:plasmid stability protein